MGRGITGAALTMSLPREAQLPATCVVQRLSPDHGGGCAAEPPAGHGRGGQRAEGRRRGPHGRRARHAHLGAYRAVGVGVA